MEITSSSTRIETFPMVSLGVCVGETFCLRLSEGFDERVWVGWRGTSRTLFSRTQSLQVNF